MERVLEVRRCWCGARITREYVGTRLDQVKRKILSWEACSEGHVQGVRHIPANLGSPK